ncbi:MAG: BCCT family transporter [Jiangellales bacterium]
MSLDTLKPPTGNAGLVLRISLGIAAAVFLWALLDPDSLTSAASIFTLGALETADWFFLTFATMLLIMSLALGFSRFGRMRLGRDDECPEFSTVSWISMLFAGGMGAGLIFWGAAEPLTHYQDPPGLTGNTPEAAREAMVITHLHWGLHAWAIYGMCALVIGYFTFRKGMRPLTSSPIKAVFPATPRGALVAADVLAVLAVLFGIVGSLVQGVLQLRAGVTSVFETDPESNLIATLLIVALTVAFMLSASTSVDKGIRILSNTNVALTVALVLFVLFTGPTRYMLETLVTSFGDYAQRLVEMAFRLFPYEGLTEWTSAWTLNYFLWWLAWGPFVGIFIARISRGRTIREFVLGVVFVPALFSVFWFAVLGGAGIFIESEGAGGLGPIVTEDVSAALFAFLGNFPAPGFIAIGALLILFVFLVTSADSGTFVLAMMTEDGDENPPVSRKLLWGMILAAMTLAITLVGTVPVARAMAVLGAVPFTVVLVVQMGAFVKTIRQEPAAAGRVPAEPERPPPAPAETPPPVAVATEHDQDGQRS